jgi:hypothetical protein
LRLIKRYAMLPLVFATLTLVPFKSNIIHMYIVSIMSGHVNIWGPNGLAVKLGAEGPAGRADCVRPAGGRELMRCKSLETGREGVKSALDSW